MPDRGDPGGLSAFPSRAARRLGADDVVLSNDAAQMQRHRGDIDFVLDTVSATHDIDSLMATVKCDGTLCLLGMPDKPLSIHPMGLVAGRRRLAGSGIGGIPETQEMLDFCDEHSIVADIEPIDVAQVGEAYARIHKNDVNYRFVLDLATL